MKIILINTDPMVAKLIEATAKKTGIMLTSYASTDELDVSTLTKDHFVFVDEGALGTDKDRIKSIAQDYLSCLLYAKTKALKEFSHIVKKPFLPTEILDILQAELLKVGQDLHNASEVTQEEIAQVDDGPKMPDIDMSALDKLGDFDITQEFDAESPIPPLADSVSTDIADTPSAESEPEQVPQESAQESVDESLGDVESSALEQGGLEELDNAINFLEESDMEDLEAIGAGELPAQEDEAGDSVESTEITDSLAAVDSSLDELGEQELDSSSEPVEEPQTEELLESSDTGIALDTSLEQNAQELADDTAGDMAESAQDLEEGLAQDELLETIQEEIDSSDPQAQADDQAGDIAELGAVEEVPSAIELDELESSAQDEVSGVELGEADLAESGAALEQVEDQASDVEQELDNSETSAQGGESATAESLEEQAECEVLPQDELALVKNLLEETTPADTTESLESIQETEAEVDFTQELESSTLEDSSESGDGANDESELESSTQEFADIELDDLAQVEPESSAQEATESAGEDYLQLSESEICQALGEDLPDVESSASTEAADIEIEAGDVESSADPSELETPEEQASEQLEPTQEQKAVEEQAIEEIAEVAEDEAMAMEESGGDLQEDIEEGTEEAAYSVQNTQEQEIESMQEFSQDSSDEGLESKESAQAEVALEEDLEEDLAQDLGDLEESATTDEDLGEELESSALEQECQAPEELEVSSELESMQEAGGQEAQGQDLAQELESKETLDSMVAHDLQELEAEPTPDQGVLQDLGEFGTGLQAINALRDEMQSLGDLDPFASDGGDTPSLAQADDRPSTTQANQTQAQLFSELLANKSAQEIRSLLNGAQISINISFSDKI